MISPERVCPAGKITSSAAYLPITGSDVSPDLLILTVTTLKNCATAAASVEKLGSIARSSVGCAELTALIDADSERLPLADDQFDPASPLRNHAARIGLALARLGRQYEVDAGERCNWLTTTRSAPLMMNSPLLSTAIGMSPKYTSSSIGCSSAAAARCETDGRRSAAIGGIPSACTAACPTRTSRTPTEPLCRSFRSGTLPAKSPQAWRARSRAALVELEKLVVRVGLGWREVRDLHFGLHRAKRSDRAGLDRTNRGNRHANLS